MNTKLILRTKPSPFLAPFKDQTLGSILSQENVDDNFIYLKGESIYSAQVVGDTIKLNKLNGQTVNIDITKQNADVITGGTYNKTTGIATFTNHGGVTFDVPGFFTEADDVYITGGTHDKATGITTFTNNFNKSFTVTNLLKESDIIYINDLTTGGLTQALSAEQGKVLKTQLDSEINRATTIESGLNVNLTNEINRAISAETALNTVISTEIKRATDKENDLQTIITTETTRATSAETASNTALTNEVNRATSAETVLNTSITNETNRSVSAETALQNTKEDKSNKGIANGYTPLDEFKKVASEYLNIVDNLVSGGTTSILSAEQGKVLQTKIDAINTILSSNDVDLDSVQELVDALKTIKTELHNILINDLTTGGIAKALTAEQGKVLKGLIDDLNTALNKETTRSISAETALNDSVITETNRAVSAETILNTAIVAETKRASDKEIVLQTAISEETLRAVNKEDAILGVINNETNRAISAETDNTSAIIVETTRATSAETTLQTNINNELNRATNAENALQTSISNENKRAVAGESVLQSTINNVSTRITLLQTNKEEKANKGAANGYAPLDGLKKVAGDFLYIVNDLTSGGVSSILSAEQGKVLQTKIDGINTILKSNDVNLDSVQELVDALKSISSELHNILVNDLTTGGVTKALTAEQGKVLKDLFETGVKNLTTAEKTLETAIASETNRANIVEEGLQRSLDFEVLRATSAETALNTSIVTETNRATSAETALNITITNESNRALSAETALNTALTNEVTRATNVENTKADKTVIDSIKLELQNNIDSEKLRATNAENTLQQNITNENKRATAGESAIQTSLNTTDSRVTKLETIKEEKANKGIPGGYVPLDDLKKIASEYLNIVDNLTSGGATLSLSAEQGKTLKSQIDGIKVILASDDINLDTVQELVGAIKELQTSFSTILVNDVTTGGTTKALTAEQGKILKTLLDKKTNTDDVNLDTLQKVVTEVKANKIDKTTLIHTTGDETKKGRFIVLDPANTSLDASFGNSVILAKSDVKIGLSGLSDSAQGVYGHSNSFTGVEGDSITGNGVLAHSDSGIGLNAKSESGKIASFNNNINEVAKIENNGNISATKFITSGGTVNQFVTGDGTLGMPTLQQVTDKGNTTNNDIVIQGAKLGYNNISHNLYFGYLNKDTTGSDNLSLGNGSLVNNTSGFNNVSLGTGSLRNNTKGTSNLAISLDSLGNNITGDYNIALGVSSLKNNTAGSNNASLGINSLSGNTIGNNNVALGSYALSNNTEGSSNVAIGVKSLSNNTTGNNNVVIGMFTNPITPTNKDGNLAIHSSNAVSEEPLVQGNFIDRWFKIAGKILLDIVRTPDSKVDTTFTKILTAKEDGTIGWEDKATVSESNIYERSSGSYSTKSKNDTTIVASGIYSYAEGANTQSTGKMAHSEGNTTKAIGDNSHSEGYFTTASGTTSHAEGQTTIAGGNGSHAEGGGSMAMGIRSHAEGDQTKAIGDYSHAEGGNTMANGSYSHAGGYKTTANGSYSYVTGQNSTVTGRSSVVLGENITGNADNTVYVSNLVSKRTNAIPSGSNDPIGEEGSIIWYGRTLYWKSGDSWLKVDGYKW